MRAQISAIAESITVEMVEGESFVRFYFPVDKGTKELLIPGIIGKPETVMHSVGYLVLKQIYTKTDYYPLVLSYTPVLTLPAFVGTAEPLGGLMTSFVLPISKKRIVVSQYGNTILSFLYAIASLLPRNEFAGYLPTTETFGEEPYLVVPAVVSVRIPGTLQTAEYLFDFLEPYSKLEPLTSKIFVFERSSSYSVAHLVRALRGEFTYGNLVSYWDMGHIKYEMAREMEHWHVKGRRTMEGVEIKSIDEYVAREVRGTPLWLTYKKNNVNMTIVAELKPEEVFNVLPPTQMSSLKNVYMSSKEQEGVSLSADVKDWPDRFVDDFIKTLLRPALFELVNMGKAIFTTKVFDWFITSINLPFNGSMSLLGGLIQPDNEVPTNYYLPLRPDAPNSTVHVVEGISIYDVAGEIVGLPSNTE